MKSLGCEWASNETAYTKLKLSFADRNVDSRGVDVRLTKIALQRSY
ncbi:MAG: hypothetical protein ACKESB_01105 [Candidatus Hodgkinia cicadicola]